MALRINITLGRTAILAARRRALSFLRARPSFSKLFGDVPPFSGSPRGIHAHYRNFAAGLVMRLRWWRWRVGQPTSRADGHVIDRSCKFAPTKDAIEKELVFCRILSEMSAATNRKVVVAALRQPFTSFSVTFLKHHLIDSLFASSFTWPRWNVACRPPQ